MNILLYNLESDSIDFIDRLSQKMHINIFYALSRKDTIRIVQYTKLNFAVIQVDTDELDMLQQIDHINPFLPLITLEQKHQNLSANLKECFSKCPFTEILAKCNKNFKED